MFVTRKNDFFYVIIPSLNLILLISSISFSGTENPLQTGITFKQKHKMFTRLNSVDEAEIRIDVCEIRRCLKQNRIGNNRIMNGKY